MRHPVRLVALALIAAAAAALPAPARAEEREDPNLRRGRIQYKSGKYNEAINELRVALRRNNRNAEAHLWLGKSYARISEFDKAAEHLQQSVQIQPENEEGYRELGQAYLELDTRARAKGQAELAKEFLEKAERAAQTLEQRKPQEKQSYEFLIRLAKHRADIFREKGDFNKEQDQYDEALRYCDKVLEVDPNDISTHLDRIEILFGQRRFKECERRCNEALKINPKLHSPKLTLAKIRRAAGDKEGAIAILTEILTEKKTQIEALLRRAEIYLDMQKYEEALADANEAIRLTNRNPYANFIRGCVYMQLKKLDAAIQELQQATAGMSRHLPSHFWLARCLLMKDRTREAIEELNTVVKLDPRFVVARLILASAHLQQGYPDGAVSTLVDALHFDAKNVEVRRLLGIAYLHKEEHDKAQQQFQKMLELDPEAARAHQVLAGLALAKDKIDEAISHCHKALEVEPKNVDVHFLLGMAYMRRGRFEGAKSEFEQVLRLRGRHPGARMNLASVHLQLREFDLAQEQYQRCIEEDPTLVKPRYNLARLYMVQGKYDKAEAELTQLLKIESEKATVHLHMAELHRYKGEKEKAAQAAKAALGVDPKLLAARVFLARLYIDDQNWPSALAELNAALKEDLKFAPAYEAAVIHVYLGQYEEAVKLFEKAVHNDVAPSSSLAGIAAALQLKGDHRAALANISQADAQKPQDPLITLQTANVYLGQGDAANSRTLIRQATFIPEVVREAYISFIENFINDKARSRAVSDALTRVIFYGSRGWHPQAEQNCNLLLKLAPDNTFAYTVLANVYLSTRKTEQEIAILKRLIDVAPKDYRHRVRLGRRLGDVGRFTEARQEFERAAAVAPDKPEPLLQLAAYFFRLAQYELAAENAQKALKLDEKNAQALAIVASCHLADRKLDKAKEVLKQLTENPSIPKGTLPFIQVAELDLLEGKVDEAIKKYNEAVEQNPRSVPARMGLARAYLRKGNVADAIEQLKEVLDLDATHAAALLDLARVYRMSGRFDLALEYCERVAGITPSASEVRYELAAIRRAQNKPEEAIAEYNLVLKDSPNDLRALIGIAQATFESGDHRAAIDKLTDLLKQRHPLPPVQDALVGFYKRTGEIDKAQAELESLVKATPERVGAYDLAILYIHKDKLDAALQLIEETLGQQPTPALLAARGAAFQLKGRLPDAIAAFKEARERNPKQPILATLLANAHIAAGEAAKAREAIASVELSEEMAAAYGKLVDNLSVGGDKALLAASALNQAALYADAGWLTLARDRYERLLKTLPDNLAVLQLLAGVQEGIGDRAQCIATYQRMLQAAPDYEPALRRLAAHHLGDKNFEAAAGIYRRLLEKKPNDVGLLLAMATILQRQEKTSEAIGLYKEIIKQDANNAIAYNNLAWIYAIDTKDLKQAEALASKASDLTSADSGAGAAVRDTLAWIYYLTERYDKAMEFARQAVDGMPGSAEVHYHLGMICFKRNLRATAARHLLTALRIDPNLPQKDEVNGVLDRIRGREP